MSKQKKPLEMVEKAIIYIAETVAPIVSSRDIAANLEQNVAQFSAVRVYLDFANVEFVSRSAAHQLMELKESFQHKEPKKEIVFDFDNANKDVRQMFRIIASNRVAPEHKPRTEPIKTTLDSLLRSAK